MPTPLHVLHIDDSPAILETVKYALGDEMVVDGAISLSEARRILERQHFDILLVDLGLGDSGGVATIEALKGYNIPIVVLSGLDDPEILEAAAEAGASDYLTKPAISSVRLKSRMKFTHARHQRQIAREKQLEVNRRVGEKRKVAFEAVAFEALKPFISCADVGSRAPFARA